MRSASFACAPESLLPERQAPRRVPVRRASCVQWRRRPPRFETRRRLHRHQPVAPVRETECRLDGHRRLQGMTWSCDIARATLQERAIGSVSAQGTVRSILRRWPDDMVGSRFPRRCLPSLRSRSSALSRSSRSFSGSSGWRGTVNDTRRDIGLGGFPCVTLAEARQTAFEYRKVARAGGDPKSRRPARQHRNGHWSLTLARQSPILPSESACGREPAADTANLHFD